MKPIRVLLVDDSAFARKVLREVLAGSPQIEVVGAARDGLEALEKITELAPDVVTLDLVMPNLDGIAVLRASIPRDDRPEFVVVSISDSDSALGVEALSIGAFDVVHKPTALATSRLYDLAGDLVKKVIAAGERRLRRGLALPPDPVSPPARLLPATKGTRLVVVGTSTGGPQALARLLTALPGELPVPVAIALHIPEGYTRTLAQRLNGSSVLEVVEASDRTELKPGRVVLARGGSHLTIVADGDRLYAEVGNPPGVRSPYLPSVDLLFRSAAEAAGSGVLGVVLTGMGDDGLDGSRRIREAGGRILTEAESSSVVWGMPRCVWEAGLATAEAPLPAMADLIVRNL